MHKEIMHLIKGELIEKKVRIISKTKEFNGKIVDETKNTFVVLIDGTQRKVLKASNKFQFNAGEKKITIKGEKLIASPEERSKTK